MATSYKDYTARKGINYIISRKENAADLRIIHRITELAMMKISAVSSMPKDGACANEVVTMLLEYIVIMETVWMILKN